MSPNIHPGAIVCLIKLQLVALIAVLFMSGAPGASIAAPVNARVMTTQYFELVLARGDAAAIAAIVAPDALLHTPEGDFRGHTGLSAFTAKLESSFSGLRFVTADATIEGDYAAVQWTMSGTHTGNYLGVNSTCVAISVSGIAMLRFDESRITEQWIEYDRMALVQQLQSLSQVDTHSQSACAPSTAPTPTEQPVPVCGPDCDKPRGYR
jgi:predicted ester cyclase